MLAAPLRSTAVLTRHALNHNTDRCLVIDFDPYPASNSDSGLVLDLVTAFNSVPVLLISNNSSRALTLDSIRHSSRDFDSTISPMVQIWTNPE
ncbi:hypothetical protein EVAR_61856_1 [Eumeta japonica]|uniref:Uncharacterized protein n=1 Tax=Eumeta variegata TaxID=151549 RepID=A0A4C1ZEK4_EUMVA|nr:hypothetical protein EVAR_61856_1 [Eumeta japonica]